MTTSELKSYIDRILGNSVRLLLPSYWWKRAFGAVIDKVDEVDSRISTKQDKLVSGNNIKTINGSSLLGIGNLEIKSSSDITVDAQMSASSTNPVQNKVVTTTLNTKADKTSIPTKTSDLINDNGFLTKHQDISHLASKTYVDEKDDTKQDKLVSGNSIKTINGNSILGSGDIKVVADTSNLATKSEVNAKQDKITDLETIRSGAAKGATALQSYTEKYTGTVTGINMNGTSKGTSGVVDLGTVITEHQDISHLATTAEVQIIVDEVIETEEIYAATVNDLNSRISSLETDLPTEANNRESLQLEFQKTKTQIVDNEEVIAATLTDLNERINNNYQEGVDTYATKATLNNEVVSINTAIVENEEVIAATLNDLLSQIEALRVRVEQLENA